MGKVLVAEEDKIKSVIFNPGGATLFLDKSIFKKPMLEINCDMSERDLIRNAKKVRIVVELI